MNTMWLPEVAVIDTWLRLTVVLVWVAALVTEGVD
jgi:hypothetical protein